MKTAQLKLNVILAGTVGLLMSAETQAADGRLSQFAQRDAGELTTPGRVKRAQNTNARDALTTRLSGQLLTTTEQGIQDRQRELRRIEMRRMIQQRIRDKASPVLAQATVSRPTAHAAKDAQQTTAALTRKDVARQVLSDYRAATASAYTRSTTSRLHNDTTAVSLARASSGDNGRGSTPALGTDPRRGDIQGIVRRPSPRRHPNLPADTVRADGTVANDGVRLDTDRPTATRPNDGRTPDNSTGTIDADTRPSNNQSTSRRSASLR